jgi:uncharacterized protein YutE (UPF0331/DUF86 family)
VVDEVRVVRLLRSASDSLQSLAREQTATAECASTMRRATGFRNVLVREYVEVDDDIMVARLSDLTDLKRFVREVSDWLART